MIDKEHGNKIQKQTKRTKKLNKKEKKIKTEIDRKKKSYLCELGHDLISGVKDNLRQQQNRLYGLKPAHRLIMFSLQTQSLFFSSHSKKK
jgi:hypothetical protein